MYASIFKNLFILTKFIIKLRNATIISKNHKPADVKSSTRFDFNVEYNDKDLKFKAGDHVTISNYKTILQKVTLQIGLKKFL